MPLRGFFSRNIVAVHYCVRIFIGASILWLFLHNEQTTNSLWAIISLIVVTEPQIHPAWIAAYTLIKNTIIGCTVALFCLLSIGVHIWLLSPAVCASAFISALLNKVQQGWRNAPVNTAIIMSAAMMQKSTVVALTIAEHRTMEVILGGVTALVITRAVAFLWLPEEVKQTALSACESVRHY